MANTNIEIPDFDFSAFFFPQILESLIQFKRQNVPELTDESEFEPFIQLLRAFALVGHLNNTLVDLVANESTLPTARLVESVRNMLRLIDFELNPATPSQVELLYELSRTFASSVTLVPASAQAATQRSGDDPIITVEVDEALIITRTDQIGAAASEEDVAVTDRTAALISTLPGDDFAPWITPNVGDVVYFGHPEIMFDKLTLDITSGWSAAALGVWEFFEGDFLQIAPDQVQQIGPILRVSLNNLLGTFTREGTFIRVTLNETGAFEEVVSQFSGGLNFVDIGFLGQTAPSANVEDYSVGSDWTAIDDVTDGTNGLDQSGDVEYSIPQSVEKNWKKETVGGVEAFWIRFRLVTIGFGSPVLRNALIDDGNQFAIRLATQGISAADDPLGSSTGLPDQRFETSRDNFIRKSETVTVDGETWASVKDFLNSAPTDEHYVIELGENDRATVVFGSGNQGKIPPIGAGNISISYRFGAQDEGNVGPNTIVVDKQGLTFINSITNPRQASGHQQADGADEASLERVKISGPASLRTKTVALGPTDVEELTRAFATVQGSRLFTRALAVEEGLGPKTIELIVVLAGGGLASTEQLETLDEFFNGDKFSLPLKPKRIVANQEVTAFNFTPRAIDIDAVVTTTATVQQIVNRLQQVIQPEALKDDGVTFEWLFGGEVPRSRIIHEIFETDDSTIKVNLISPASDILLGPRELPLIGTVTISILAP